MDTVLSPFGMASHLSRLASSSENDENQEKNKGQIRQKRKYRCRVRSPSTIERAKRQRRDKANARERRRMNSLNDALEHLRSALPQPGEEPKMTKIETLRFAQQYIRYLTGALCQDDPQSTVSSPLNSPVFAAVPPADLSTEALMFSHLLSKSSDLDRSSPSNSVTSYSLTYSTDPSPSYPSSFHFQPQ
ncbi:ngn-1 [Pristionchus pacificus]|uniref:Ngn-1 n=1 Tax=Pristionchus pacificus TaxID=54126 RepID=A0A2A6CBF4_PRIPA|nr:ngn-1 [Pristionchus pacificus]|eukprot:PDM75552.1 ngn-1 [Pristionchus pacificus]